MNLKKYAGKDVIVQFKAGYGWYVAAAPVKGTMPDLVRVKGQDGQAGPVVTPFIQGTVSSDGEELVVDTGRGGKVAISVAHDAVFAITSVVEPAVQDGTSPLIVLAGN